MNHMTYLSIAGSPVQEVLKLLKIALPMYQERKNLVDQNESDIYLKS